MKTKYQYFAISDNLFYNNGDFCMRVRANVEFPSIEFLEDYDIDYYIKQWKHHTVEINKHIFDKRFKEISELINSRLNKPEV